MDGTVEIMNPKPKSHKLTKLLLLATVTSSFGTFQHGYSIWIVQNPTAIELEFDNIAADSKARTVTKLSTFKSYFAIVVLVFPAGGLLGSLVLGFLVDNLGRKYSLLLTNTFTVFSAVLLGFSKVVGAYEFAIFARFVTGICSGTFSCMVPLYIEEISPVNFRGALTMVPVLFLILGHLVAQILAFQNFLGNMEGYPFLMSFNGIVAIFSFILLFFCPESPRFLWIQKKEEEKARNILQKLRDQEDVEDEIAELRLEALSEKGEKNMTVLKLLRHQELRWHVISLIVLMVGNQVTGVNGVYIYAERAYDALGTEKTTIRFITIGVNCIVFAVAFATMYTIDSVGRRFLLLIGFMICNMACILLALILEIQIKIPSMIHISSFLFIIFFIGHMIGPAPIPYIVAGEMFLQSSRASAYVIGGFMNWFTRILLGVIFIKIESYFGPYCLLIFWPFCMATFIYIFKMVPETKGRTFLEVRKHMEAHIAEESS